MIEQDQAFRNYNLYRRAVRRGLAQPYTHHCGAEYIAGFGENDEFVLNCYTCDTTVVPGIAALERIEAVVKEVFGE